MASVSALVGASSAANAPQGDGLSKRLATMFQEELDEYRKANPDFPVSTFSAYFVIRTGDRFVVLTTYVLRVSFT